MKCINASWIAVLALVAFWPSLLFGAIPQSINYQGRLTTAIGAPITGAANLVFTICGDSLCTQQLWTEPQSGIIISNGLFDVRLGSVNPIPLSVLNGSLRWLAITVEGQAGSRRFPLQSVPYSYRSIIADTADYVKNAGGSNCADCNTIFVNVIGPDSVYSSSGTAFLGKAEGAGASELRGVAGYASNTSSGHAYGGYFSTAAEGTGIHYGLRADGNGAAAVNTYGVLGSANNTSSGNTYGGRFTVNTIGTGTHYALSTNASSSSSSASYGIDATSYNTSSGDAYGGRFSALTNGTGVHYALSADAAGSSSSAVYGLNSTASNSSTGAVYGAALTAEAGGTGTHYGAYVNSDGVASATTYGVWSEANNTSAAGTGNAYGGYFRGTSSGTGRLWGVSGNAAGASASDCYAVYGYGTNSSSGDIYGGYFITGSAGTGVHYGVKSEGNGSSSGEVYGGYFTTGSSGTGVHFGLRSEGNGSSTSAVHGIISGAVNTSTGSTYGGTFTATSTGTGTHYGVYSQSSSSSSKTAYAVYGTADNSSSGRAYGGYFTAANSGTGEHTGVYAEAYNNDPTPCFAVFGYADNTYPEPTGLETSYGGYFVSKARPGQEGKIGIYAEAAYGGGNYAGYFAGSVKIADHLSVLGTKSAVVKVDNGEYRALYCQESPENWFEDFGEGQLTNGRVHIELDPLYLQTVIIDKDQPIKVFIQLNDENCNGTAVRRGSTGFDVIELQNGTSNAAFSYRVVAKRKNYENKRLDVIPGPTPEEMKAQSATIQAKFEADRAATRAANQQVSKDNEASKREPATEEEK